MSRLENLLIALINEDDVKDFEPQSRIEAILKACCTGEECGVEPQSRIEALLKILHTKICGSGSQSNFALADGFTLVTSDGNTFNAKEI